jgi:threonine dehydrogenase-like Zn-dependent dehydrogenase
VLHPAAKAGVDHSLWNLQCGRPVQSASHAAAFRGATVIAIDVDPTKLDVARRAGAKHTVNVKRENVHEALVALTGGHGPDVIIEAIGSAQTFRMAVEEVAYTGRVVYIGYAKEPVAYETKLFVQKEIDILGSRNALPADCHRSS